MSSTSTPTKATCTTLAIVITTKPVAPVVAPLVAPASLQVYKQGLKLKDAPKEFTAICQQHIDEFEKSRAAQKLKEAQMKDLIILFRCIEQGKRFRQRCEAKYDGKSTWDETICADAMEYACKVLDYEKTKKDEKKRKAAEEASLLASPAAKPAAAKPASTSSDEELHQPRVLSIQYTPKIEGTIYRKAQFTEKRNLPKSAIYRPTFFIYVGEGVLGI